MIQQIDLTTVDFEPWDALSRELAEETFAAQAEVVE